MKALSHSDHDGSRPWDIGESIQTVSTSGGRPVQSRIEAADETPEIIEIDDNAGVASLANPQLSHSSSQQLYTSQTVPSLEDSTAPAGPSTTQHGAVSTQNIFTVYHSPLGSHLQRSAVESISTSRSIPSDTSSVHSSKSDHEVATGHLSRAVSLDVPFSDLRLDNSTPSASAFSRPISAQLARTSKHASSVSSDKPDLDTARGSPISNTPQSGGITVSQADIRVQIAQMRANRQLEPPPSILDYVEEITSRSSSSPQFRAFTEESQREVEEVAVKLEFTGSDSVSLSPRPRNIDRGKEVQRQCLRNAIPSLIRAELDQKQLNPFSRDDQGSLPAGDAARLTEQMDLHDKSPRKASAGKSKKLGPKARAKREAQSIQISTLSDMKGNTTINARTVPVWIL